MADSFTQFGLGEGEPDERYESNLGAARRHQLGLWAASLGRMSPPAGPPPRPVVFATVLCTLLSLPMFALAGALLTSAGLGRLTTSVLCVAALGVAVSYLIGAVGLISRGASTWAILGGVFTLLAVVVSAVRLFRGQSEDWMIFILWAVFGVIALTMMIMLSLGMSRRWMRAAGLEWRFRRKGTMEPPAWPPWRAPRQRETSAG